MSPTQWSFGVATLLAALALWLLLPRGGGRTWPIWVGVLAGLISLGLFGAQLGRLGSLPADILFFALGGLTVAASVATISFRNPVYCAIWFALSLLGTAGLFLLQGAQFLGLATVVVYAGAILVTFLFVLMLAQPEGQAFYDRLSWESLWASAAGALLAGILTAVIAGVFPPTVAPDGAGRPPITDRQRERGVLAAAHSAQLGGELFGRQLVSVEVAGALLLAALVGATAIITHGRQTPQPARESTDE
jgi:NADH-quinone oxidoreductase subunit J